MLNLSKLTNIHNDWCTKNTLYEIEKDFVEITLPIVDLNHDHIQLYLDYSDLENLFLTDDGHTLSELEMRGINIFNSPNRTKHFKQMIREFGVMHNEADNELIVKMKNIEDLPNYQLSLAQCCTRLYGFLLTSRNSVVNLFYEEVSNFFSKNEIEFIPNKEIIGKSGVSHNFDYLIKGKREKPNKLIQTINTPQNADFKTNFFSILDMKDSQKDNTEFIILGNDSEGEFSQPFLQVAESYDISIKKWSDRESWKQELSA